MSSYRHKEYEDTRNYNQEARELIKGLSAVQLYDLYDIVLKKLKLACSDTRQKELEAVSAAILATSGLDKSTLHRLKNGYRGEMAQDAKPKDGYSKPNRKKV